MLYQLLSRAAATSCVLAVLMSTSSLHVVGAAQDSTRPTDAAALKPFHAEIAKYLAMRVKLRDELPVHVPESTAKVISATSDSLAAAVQRARPKARQGDFFKGAASSVIIRRVNEAVRTANLEPVLAGIDDETPTVHAPQIYLRFPEASHLATMPPSLLAVLPPLPPELEYRIIGSYLILRDVHAALILDFIPGAVPRR